MRIYVVAACSALFGGIVGALTVAYFLKMPAEKLETKHLVLLDDKGRAAAELVSEKEKTVLRFRNSNSHAALELGTFAKNTSAFVSMYGKDGDTVSFWGSDSNAKGASILYLGDEISAARVVLGALDDNDIPPVGERKIPEWGLDVRRPGRSLAAVKMRVEPDFDRQSGVIILRKPNGDWWSAP
ncbi:MAG: hypothetical protein ABL967_11885 [Bryobacteraceae bacterium]